jgi:hypothetical protein
LIPSPLRRQRLPACADALTAPSLFPADYVHETPFDSSRSNLAISKVSLRFGRNPLRHRFRRYR